MRLYSQLLVRVQLVREKRTPPLATSPEAAVKVVREFLGKCDREVFISVLLDNQQHVVGIEEVSKGTLDRSLVSGREVFKAAILTNSASLIICHCHPSTITGIKPSQDDMRATSMIKKGGDLLGIALLDHIIVAGSEYFSFKESGLMSKYNENGGSNHEQHD